MAMICTTNLLFLDINDVSRMKNIMLPIVAGFMLIFACSTHADEYHSITMEFGADRAGADYKDIELTSNDPLACQILCAQDSKCKAYTFVPVGILTFGQRGPAPRCYLKDKEQPQKQYKGLISGKKLTSSPTSSDTYIAPGLLFSIKNNCGFKSNVAVNDKICLYNMGTWEAKRTILSGTMEDQAVFSVSACADEDGNAKIEFYRQNPSAPAFTEVTVKPGTTTVDIPNNLCGVR